MKPNKDSFSDSGERRPDAPDPLANALRHEALSERPEFSEPLFYQTLQQIRRERLSTDGRQAQGALPRGPAIWRWFIPAAAIAAIALFIPLLSRSLRSEKSDAPPIIAQITPQPADNTATAGFSMNIDNIVYERLWPPGITLSLPTVAIGTTPPAASDQPAPQGAATAALPGLPDLLFVSLGESAASATAELADVLPPEDRFLIGLVGLQ
jgi:hypothetical protein